LRDASTKRVTLGRRRWRYQWPRSDQGLVQHQFIDGTGRRCAAADKAPGCVQRHPARHRFRPALGVVAERGETRARILAAFVVVCRRAQQTMRKALCAQRASSMEFIHADGEDVRVGTDFVARKQSRLTVKQRVLDRFRGNRRG